MGKTECQHGHKDKDGCVTASLSETKPDSREKPVSAQRHSDTL